MPVTLERFPINPAASAAHAQLLAVFPAADPGFIEACITHWLACPAPAQPGTSRTRPSIWTAQALVERVGDKLLEIRPEREYPQVGPTVGCSRDDGAIAELPQVRKAFGRRSSAQQAPGQAPGASRSGGGRKREDVTLARNLALIRLHAMFPLVSIPDLRDVVLLQPHSVLSEAAETLIERARASTPGATGTRPGADFLESAANAFLRLFGGNDERRADRTRRKKGKERDLDDAEAPGDPVLTSHDLFHSPAYEATLVAHFEALFPALAPLPSAPIARIVKRDGGSYASMRDKLERAAAEIEDDRERPWWSRWTGGVATGGRGPGPGPSTEKKRLGLGRRSSSGTAGRADLHPLIREEVEAHERAQQGPALPTDWRTTTEAPAAELSLVECQCCFSSVPFSPHQLAHCADPASPEQCPATPQDVAGPPHLFCRDCVNAYVRTFTFGGASLPRTALEMFALPCISASGSSPCTRIFTETELGRILDPATFNALSTRVTATTLERAASSQSMLGTKLLSCPFCPYAEFADPLPGPLVRVFFPAWVAEPFPPSVPQILFSILGLPALLLLLLLAALLALVAPARRMERAYNALHLSETGATLLSIHDRLLLAPQELAPLSAAYLRGIVERVLRAREGDAARVFRCRNDARATALAAMGGGREGWLARLESVQELCWDAEGEGEPLEGEVEEGRRTRLVRYLWGQDEPAAQARAVQRAPPCGKLSCLLCSAAVNPTAPSLHTCRGRTSSTSSGAAEPATEQERAEESLRLVVERAMTDAVKRDCGRCGAALQKQTGHGACNKVMCRCGWTYCHYCRREIPSWQGYKHFCPHPRDPGAVRTRDGLCTQCDKCSLWDEPDEAERVRDAVEKARLVWATEHPDWAKKVDLETPVAFQPDSHEVPFFEWVAYGYDWLAVGVVRWMLST